MSKYWHSNCHFEGPRGWANLAVPPDGGDEMAAQSFDDRTALVVVDVQNDLADPGGSLYVAEGADICPRVNERIAAAGAAGPLIDSTHHRHPPATPPRPPHPRTGDGDGNRGVRRGRSPGGR